LQEALAELHKAVRLSPELARAHFHLAETLTQTGEYEAALPEYEAAARLSPKDVEFRVKYGTALAKNRPQDAISELRQAIELDPNNYVARQALGMVLRRMGDIEGSTFEFQRATELSAAADKQAEAVLQTNKGIEYLKKADSSQAIEALRSALAADPDFAEAHHYLGIAFSTTGKWGEANREFAAALQKRPSDPEIHFNYGVSLIRQGDLQGAIREFSSVIAITPRHPQAHCWLADALSRVGDKARSQSELEVARELGPCELGASR
jgi:Tfp pilus assembly protein PilF